MRNEKKSASIWSHLITACRLAVVTMVVCCLFYCAIILAVARLVTPGGAEGSLVRNEYGEVIGSELIAQGFSGSEYFWPRPSAVGYSASASGGSNLSPAGEELRLRIEDRIRKIGVEDGNPIPTELVTTSGSGLDPHIKLAAAVFQVDRIAKARGRSTGEILSLVQDHVEKQRGIFASEPLINVLALNMALDKKCK